MKQQTRPVPHRLPLTGAYNVRDVGGYATYNGRLLKPYTLFRADSLHNLTIVDQKLLLDQGLKSIIDLRRLDEVNSDPNVFANSSAVSYLNLPLHHGWQTILEKGRPDSLTHLYTSILDNAAQTIRSVMTAVSKPDAYPLMVHCQVGKDRTGVLMALLLGIAGVSHETIVADYAASRDFLEPIVEEYRNKIRDKGGDISLFEMLIQSPPAAMANTLAHLEDVYGGIRPYLQHHIGMSTDQLHNIQTQLIE